MVVVVAEGRLGEGRPELVGGLVGEGTFEGAGAFVGAGVTEGISVLVGAGALGVAIAFVVAGTLVGVGAVAHPASITRNAQAAIHTARKDFLMEES